MTKPWEGGHTIQHGHTCGETRGDKTSGRRTHHPTQAGMWGDNGRQGQTRPREGGPSNTQHTCGETMGDKHHPTQARGDKTSGRRTHHPTQAHMRGDNGRQGETSGDKTSGRRAHHPTQAHMWGDKGRQDLRKADTPSNTGTHVGRQRGTRPREGGHTIQHRHTCEDTRGGKTSGRRTHHPTHAHMWGDNGRQGQTRPREGGPSNTQHTCGETMGDKHHPTQARGDKTSGRRTHHPTQAHMRGDNGRQGETSGDKTSGRRAHHPTQAHMWGDKGRQDLRKADTPSNTGTHVGRQRGTRPREGGHTIQHRHICEDTRGGKTDTPSNTRTHVGRQWETRADKTSGRRTIQHTAHMWGDNGRQAPSNTGKGRQDLRKADTPSNTGTHVGRQRGTRPREGGHTIQHRHTCGETMGDKGEQDLGKADAPSRTGTHELGKADTPSNTKPDTLRKH